VPEKVDQRVRNRNRVAAKVVKVTIATIATTEKVKAVVKAKMRNRNQVAVKEA